MEDSQLLEGTKRNGLAEAKTKECPEIKKWCDHCVCAEAVVRYDTAIRDWFPFRFYPV